MKKLNILLFVFLSLAGFSFLKAQSTTPEPKLVVGIVIDQMRYDYLYRFESLYGENGLKKLMNKGSNFTFAHYNYVPTYTGPGHTSIYTGTTPYFHGIIANDWYDRKTGRSIYCTSDHTVKTVGGNDDSGEESPKRLLSTTITDQLKLATNGKSKVIAISIKDRASILPGGHYPDAAYWYDPDNGSFISSTYYMKALPDWAKAFNGKRLVDKYMSSGWYLSYPLEKYEMNLPDKQPFERDLFSEHKSTFPHLFNNLDTEKKYDLIRSTPYGNDILNDFAKAVLKNENLGKHNYTDFLAISYSSTDYIGHEYGPNSVEVEDTYVKLDSLVADLLSALNKQVGRGNYVLFFTADHAVAESPYFLKERNIPAGWFHPAMMKDSLQKFTRNTFNDPGVFEDLSNKQIFLNYKVIKSLKLNLTDVRRAYADYLRQTFPLISQIYTRDDLEKLTAYRTSPNLVLNGFNPARSGDVAFELQPAYQYSSGGEATTHGSIYNYDTHVPLIFYGWHVPTQTVNTPVYTVDIAPTIADLLKIQEPSASMGIPIIK
jgi:predicted AlkP superfamily pyrophosphatase or phosphodiesterase